MSRRKLKFINYHQAFHFSTFATNHRIPLLKPDKYRNCLIREIKKLNQRSNCKIIIAVVLDDHCHILLQIIDKTKIQNLIANLKQRAAHQILERLAIDPIHEKLIGGLTKKRYRFKDGQFRVFQMRFYDRVVRDEIGFQKVYTYILNNPIKHRLVKTRGEAGNIYFRIKIKSGIKFKN